ncbi:MAG: glycosyltransferase, partial [Verrucomicrobiota bacterium]
SLVSSIAAKADFSWHAEREARSAYCAVNAKPIWVQMGADPVICHPLGGMKRMVKACFIGQRYADRDRWLAALLDAKVPLDVFGSGWGAVEPSSLEVMPGEESVYLGRPQMRPGSYSAYWRAIRQTIQSTGVVGGIARLYEQHRYRTKSRLLDERMREVARGRASNMAATFAQYEVVLNLSNVWADGKPGSALISHVRLRDFEAPMTRSCYLTGHTEELEEFYEIGREIDTYRSLEEFVDKTRFYLATPAAADALREAGYRRAVRDHTWVRRFEELFRKIGMPGI